MKARQQTLTQGGTLPKYDLVVLPLLAIFTVVGLFFLSNAIAARLFQESISDSCAVSDPVIVSRFRSNCVSHVKAAEAPWVENRYNSCGFRTDAPCGPHPPNSIRIVLLGSSASMAAYVPVEQGFSSVAANLLAQRYRKPIEVQNMGRVACSPICTLHRLNEAFALNPDILMMSVSPHDLEMMEPRDLADRDKPMTGQGGLAATESKGSWLAKLNTSLLSSRATFAVEHYMFQSPLTYVRVYMNYGGKAAYLRPQLSPEWNDHLSSFAVVLGEISERAKARNIPFILVEVPSLAQASLAGLKGGLPNADPHALNDRLAEMSRLQGVLFVDPLNDFKSRPDTNNLFYVMDGHMDGAGNELVGKAVAASIQEAQLPVLVRATANGL